MHFMEGALESEGAQVMEIRMSEAGEMSNRTGTGKSEFFPNRKDILTHYEAVRPAREELLSALEERIIKELHRGKEESSIVRGRIKAFPSYFDKLLRLYSTWNGEGTPPQPDDILAIRIVHPFLESLRTTEHLLRSLFEFEEIERKGEDLSFNTFGYQSIHLLVKVPADLSAALPSAQIPRFEIQIRTILQDAWAEVEHELVYKNESGPFGEPIRRKLAALNANLTLSDLLFQEIRDYQRKLHAQLMMRRELFKSSARGKGAAALKRRASPHKSSLSPIDKGSDTLEDHLMGGLLAHNEHRFADAVAIYSRIIELDPPVEIKSVIFLHRGIALFSLENYGAALDDFSAAIALDCENSRSFYYRAESLRFLGRSLEAIEDFNRALRLDPYNRDYFCGRAHALYDTGNRVEAAEDCRRTLSLNPESAEAMQLLKQIEGKSRKRKSLGSDR